MKWHAVTIAVCLLVILAMPASAAQALRSDHPCVPLLPNPIPQKDGGMLHFGNGQDAERQGDLQRAIREYCTALAITPLDRIVEAAFRTFDALGDPDRAVALRTLHFNMSFKEAVAANLLTKTEREQYQKDLATKRAEQRAEFEEQKQQQEAERNRAEEELQQRRAMQATEQQGKQSKLSAAKVEQEQRLAVFLARHHAVDLSDTPRAYAFLKNPFAYQGKQVLLYGGYKQHIGPHQAIITIVPEALATPNFVQWDTARNLAERAVSGSPFVRCVVKVLGTVRIQQGLIEREIPHVKEVECLE